MGYFVVAKQLLGFITTARMKKLKRHDLNIRKGFKKNEHTLRIFKSIQANELFFTKVMWKASDMLANDTNKTFSKARMVNRCVERISRKAVLKRFKLSRQELRERATSGKVNGLKKAVW